jgi:putative Holliday junction resolvase
MARILAIDYGKKRCGLAVTDPLQIIANGLTFVQTNDIFDFISKYIKSEEVELFLVGMPVDLFNRDTDATQAVRTFIALLKEKFPKIPVQTIDERFSSKMAMNTLVSAGTSKKFRREKGNIDQVSATIILQDWLSRKK